MRLAHPAAETRGDRAAHRQAGLPRVAVGPAVLALDALLILASGAATGIVYHLWALDVWALDSEDTASRFLGVAAVMAALVLPAAHLSGLYRAERLVAPGASTARLALIWVGALAFLTTVAFALKIGDLFSRGSVMSFAVAGLVALAAHRVAWGRGLKVAIAAGRIAARRVVLVGDGARAGGVPMRGDLARAGISVLRHLRLPPPDAPPDDLEAAARDIVAAVRASEATEVLISADWSRFAVAGELIARLRVLPVPVHFVQDAASALLVGRPWQQIGGLVAVEVQRAPLGLFERGTKRCLDVAAAGLGLAILAPVLAAAALAIRLESRGPVLFHQTRLGFNGVPFRIVKFRSMVVAEDGATVTQASPGDARVTRVGRWIRRFSIDELPQLWNVLRGEMSIVGPRPHALAHDNYYGDVIANYAFRHHVKPGLTGWAQVNGSRGPTPTVASMKARVEHDVWYVNNWSLWLDVRLMARTPLVLLRSGNAF